jgi:hypothetical protein
VRRYFEGRTGREVLEASMEIGCPIAALKTGVHGTLYVYYLKNGTMADTI